MKKVLINILNKLPYIRGLHASVKTYQKGFPPGHFYSPIVNLGEVENYSENLFNQKEFNLPIELKQEEQMTLLKQMLPLYAELPFTEKKSDGNYYYYENDTYSYSDAIFLYLVIRHFSPKRIIEVGSGFSTSVMFDVNNHFFSSNIDISLVEPFPYHLKQAFGEDLKHISCIPSKAQDTDTTFYNKLNENDILFIDSTHVSKTGSDVNHLIFTILPSLNKGVLIHIHDIFYPFEYPEAWVKDSNFHKGGFGWN